MARFEFRLPDIGEGVVEGEIVRWLVKAGDDVVEDQPLVEVMTDKATVTIPSPRRGKVVSTVGKEGEVAKVHATLVVMDVGGAEAPSPPPAPPPAAAPTPQGNGEEGRRFLATPVTRKMARELGVDLGALQGTGPLGRVMKADVLAFVSRPPPAPPAGPDERRPLRGLRKSIARAMAQSHAHVVPFTFVEECDTARLSQTRDRINQDFASSGKPKLSYLPFITRAIVRAFRKFPDMNAVMDEEKQELVVKKQVNMGYGAATEQGLTVFVVKDAGSMSIRRLGAEIDRLAQAARENKLQLAELQGGTFTITSLGKDGGLMATPVVHHPEVAILGVHKIKDVPRVRDGQIAIGQQMNLSCSFDHRVIDGHVGAAFLYEVIAGLEAPELLLID